VVGKNPTLWFERKPNLEPDAFLRKANRVLERRISVLRTLKHEEIVQGTTSVVDTGFPAWSYSTISSK
jgi:hypothetical protein